MKSTLQATLLLLSSAMLFACGGGGSDDSASETPPEDVSAVSTIAAVPYSSDYSNYKASTRAATLIAQTDTTMVSVGVFDSGFRTEHHEFSDRQVAMQNYDDVSLNNDFVSGVYGSNLGSSWSWTDHGSAVASVAFGRNIGMAPQAEAVTSMNRNVIGAFDADGYYASFSRDTYGFLPEGLCVQIIEPMNYPWCVDFQSYHVKKMQDLAAYAMPVVNFSFTSPFGHYQTGVDMTFDLTRWNNGSLSTDFARAYIPEFYNLYYYGFNVAYEYTRALLADGELVIVNSAGNDGASITQEQVLDWQYLQANSANPLAQTIVNVFFDPDVDANNNDMIEDSERGLTEGLLYVGALNKDGELAWYSNTPGTSAEVQARFLVAPGNVWVADASGGIESYAKGTGTSFAAPVVSGAIALLKARHPAKTAREIANAILATANKAIPNYSATTHGQGLLDVFAADEYLEASI